MYSYTDKNEYWINERNFGNYDKFLFSEVGRNLNFNCHFWAGVECP